MQPIGAATRRSGGGGRGYVVLGVVALLVLLLFSAAVPSGSDELGDSANRRHHDGLSSPHAPMDAVVRSSAAPVADEIHSQQSAVVSAATVRSIQRLRDGGEEGELADNAPTLPPANGRQDDSAEEVALAPGQTQRPSYWKLSIEVKDICPPSLRQDTNTVPLSELRFVTFDPVAPHFGLTNQLITYTSAMFIAARSKRALAIPDSYPSFFDLIDQRYTQDRLPCGVRIVKRSDLDVDSDKRRFPRVKLPGRTLVLSDPARARDDMDRQLSRASSRRGIRLSTVMWHVPFIPADTRARLDEHLMFQAIEFAPSVRRQARAIRKVLKAWKAPYAVLHLRMEPDLNTFGERGVIPVPPQAAHFEKYVKSCLLRRIPDTVETVYVAAGQLPQGIEEVLNRTMHPRVVVLKSNNPHLKTPKIVSADSVVAGTPITNHFDAAADLLVAVDAAFVLSAEWSSFARAVQLRRCPVKPAAGVVDPEETAKARVWTYDKKWRILSPRDCGKGQPLSSIPFYHAPGYSEDAECSVTRD